MSGLVTPPVPPPGSRLASHAGPPAGSAPGARAQLHALTSLRGIAAWWVVVYHFRELLPGGTPEAVLRLAAQGWLAVDLFFILSGFVLAMTYGERFRGGVRGYGAFIGLRLARIYPLHLLIMVLYLSVPLAVVLFSRQGASGFDFGYYVQSLLLVQNWGFNDRLLWNVPAWSISTEMFAYLFFPPIALVVFRHVRGPAASLAFSLAVMLGLALAASRLVPSLGSDIQHFGLLRCFMEFVIGIGLYRFATARPLRGAAEAWLAVAAFLGCAVLVAAGLAPDYAVMPLGFFWLIYALSNNAFGPARLLQGAPLRVLGELSYATYLVHYLVKRWVSFLLVDVEGPQPLYVLAVYLLVTLAASWVLYHRVEMPAQRWLRARLPGMLGAGRVVLGPRLGGQRGGG